MYKTEKHSIRYGARNWIRYKKKVCSSDSASEFDIIFYETNVAYFVQLQKSHKEFDLFLANAVDNLSIITYQFGDHFSHVQSDVTLNNRIKQKN